MRASPHSKADPFTRFMKLEQELAAGSEVAHMVHASKVLVPGLLQTGDFWNAWVRANPGLRARGKVWRQAIWHERRDRAALVSDGPGIVPHFYIGIGMIDTLVKLCDPETAIEQLQAVRNACEEPDKHVRLARQDDVPGDFYGHYQYGRDGEPGGWPSGVWYEELGGGATYAGHPDDISGMQDLYANAVEALEGGLAYSEDRTAAILGLAASAIKRQQWPELRSDLGRFTSYGELALKF